MRVSKGLASLALTTLALLTTAPAPARAQGLVVGRSDSDPGAERASTVVVLREGERTVLTVQSHYEGPIDDFALVLPVPASVTANDVRTVDRAIVERLERLTAPRLVEHWEEDPCASSSGWSREPTRRYAVSEESGRNPYGGGAPPEIRLEAQRVVGEYDVTVLDGAGLSAWLAAQAFEAPPRLADVLVDPSSSRTRYVVARVARDRARFEEGRVVLSPLRVSYTAPTLSIPLALGRLGPAEARDLVVVVLARQQRFAAESHPTVFVPTNLDVTRAAQRDFGAFYEALLARTFERHPDAAVVEHAWPVTRCDPCPEEAVLDAQALTTLGGDVLYSRGIQRYTPGGRAAEGVPVVRFEEPRAQGLSAEVVRRVVRRHMNEVRFCYEQVLGVDPTATGVLDAHVTLAATGAVSGATATPRAGSALPRRVVDCVAFAFRRWTFPAPQGSGSFDLGITLGSGVPTPPVVGPPTIAGASEFVATRLHVRDHADATATELVLVPAEPPMVGGREARDAERVLEAGARESWEHGFQARYVVRHPWQGAITCESPTRGRFEGAPLGADPDARRTPLFAETAPTHSTTRELASVALEEIVRTPVEDLDLTPTAPTAPTAASAQPAGEETDHRDERRAPAETPSTTQRSGGCSARSGADAGSGAAWLVVTAVLARRRRGR